MSREKRLYKTYRIPVESAALVDLAIAAQKDHVEKTLKNSGADSGSARVTVTRMNSGDLLAGFLRRGATIVGLLEGGEPRPSMFGDNDGVEYVASGGSADDEN
ncbi:MAG: hypothetical protein F4Z71_07240 [Gammaproteobacteria bacterium]|nr:hypothetical protein [Gammaproteobacteria bacterium]MYE29246.1 hypothetical protein [Gammaproteobacteria bacterium]